MTWKSGMNSFTLQPMLFHSAGRAENTAQRLDSAVLANSSTRLDSDASQSDFARMRADAEVFSRGVKYTSRVAVSGFDRSTDTWRNGVTVGGLATSSVERTETLTRDQNAAFRVDGSSGLHVLAANIEVMAHQRDESQRNSSLGINETHTSWDQQWTTWVQDEWSPSKALTLTTGLRSEAIRYAVDGAEQSHQRLLPSVALRWEPAVQWMLRTSLGAGIKPPQLAELTNQPVLSVSANTPIEPDRRGNPALRPERSVNFELALERYLPNEAGVFGANVYLRHTDDFTERRVQLEGARWVDRPFNEGFARHWGLELDGKLRTDNFGWRGATFRAHLTVPRSAVNDVRLGLTRDAREQPRYILSAGFDQTQATMSYGVSMQYSGAVQTQVAGEQAFETRSRAVFDVYTLHKINAQFNLRLSVQNLFAADTQRQMSAFASPALWSLGSTDKGVRVALVSLEGKW
jgi:iron complex outermembrane receptor protein